MSTRQKSFSESYRSRQQQARPHWHRNVNKPPFGNSRAEQNPAPRKPAVAVSSATKSMLNAFQFGSKHNRPKTSAAVPEMAAKGDDGVAAAAAAIGQENQVDGKWPLSSPEKRKDGSMPDKPPQTPAPRKPLAERVGSNGNIVVGQDAEDSTLEDCVYWKHRRSPGSSEPYSSAIVFKRGKKRARSSSPMPSPCEGYLEQRDAKDSLDLQSLNKTLKTPQADPALELWNRYSANAITKPIFQPSQITPFTQLTAASPRQSSLRRAVSCGISWPSSTKRRKVTRSDILDSAESHRTESCGTTVSRVSLLVEQIQESLARPETPRVSAESFNSSPPSQERDSSNMADSPLKNRGAPTTTANRQAAFLEVQAAQETEGRKNLSDRSSEFGDAELDNMDLSLFKSMDTVHKERHPQPAVDADIPIPVQRAGVSGAGRTNNFTLNVPRPNAAEEDYLFQEPLQHAKDAKGTQRHVQFSEFDDDEDDEFYTADLEEVMAKFENQHQRKTVPHPQRPIPMKPLSAAVQQPPKLKAQGGGPHLLNGAALSTTINQPLNLVQAAPRRSQRPIEIYKDAGDDGDEYGDFNDQDFEAAAAQILTIKNTKNNSSNYSVNNNLMAGTQASAAARAGLISYPRGVSGNGSGFQRAGATYKSTLRDCSRSGNDAAPIENCHRSRDKTSQKNGSSNATARGRHIQRFIICRIVESQYAAETTSPASRTGSGQNDKRWRREKVLVVQDESQKEHPKRKHGSKSSPRTSPEPSNVSKGADEFSLIALRQSWLETRCQPGDYVHLIGEFYATETASGVEGATKKCIVDDNQNMLILHPDYLISSTVVADSFGCMRRAVLQDRVKATGDPSEAQVYGHILHEIFQEALKGNQWDQASLFQLVEQVVRGYHLEDLYRINVTVDRAVEYLRGKMAEFQAWAKLYIKEEPTSNTTVVGRNGKRCAISINKLLDVEEHVWSPMYGLKGNIDATVQMVEKEDAGGKPSKRTLVVPFELKTGKNTSDAAHRAQTCLYTLLLSDRYDIEVACGILYYMETSEMSLIRSVRHEIRHMVMQRNELACYVRDREQLPPMLKDPRRCGKCYAQEACFVYHKLADSGDAQSAGVDADMFDKTVGHLKPAHQTFFKHWDDLLTKEEADMVKYKKELWTMSSAERERAGRCFGHVVIEPGSASEQPDAPKIYRYSYTFVKPEAPAPPPGFSFLESQLVVGEPIVVSDEAGHFALATGFVRHVTERGIQVSVDRKLDNARRRQASFDKEWNQTFAGIMDVTQTARDKKKNFDDGDCVEAGSASPVLYRLDKDEFSSGMATVRNNLVQIMTNNQVGCQQIRSLVVDGRPPKFRSGSTAAGALVDSDGDLEHGSAMNSDQRQAVEKVMQAEDYALVLGMPGTGKTTTIAHIIRCLVRAGKSVLLTSYTHTAVDNILLKLRSTGRQQIVDTTTAAAELPISVLRLGAVAKIHPGVQQFATLTSSTTSASKSIEELHELYHGPQVVATTCLGVNHALFSERRFDYCIVDEASQITLPVCLGPIRMARRFVLVGDHHQLPPLVQSAAARAGGLDESLFKRLSDAHPEAVVRLTHQYRMCADIMALSNTLVYGGMLRCGSAAVAERALAVRDMRSLGRLHRRKKPSPPLLKAEAAAAAATGPLSFPSSRRQQRKKHVDAAAAADAVECPWSRSGGSSSCWLRRVIDPAAKVCFINTDSLLPASREEARGARIVNPTEAMLCRQLVDALQSVGVARSDIGLITVYRSQLALLKHSILPRRLSPPPHRSRRLRSYENQPSRHGDSDGDRKYSNGDDGSNNDKSSISSRNKSGGEDDDDDADDGYLEMHTTDKFQGRDKEVVIVSLVRSNEARNVGELLNDWRRINVAFTRARTKLLVVGSRSTLAGNELLKTFVDMADARGWTVDLPPAAQHMHDGTLSHGDLDDDVDDGYGVEGDGVNARECGDSQAHAPGAVQTLTEPVVTHHTSGAALGAVAAAAMTEISLSSSPAGPRRGGHHRPPSHHHPPSLPLPPLPLKDLLVGDPLEGPLAGDTALLKEKENVTPPSSSFFLSPSPPHPPPPPSQQAGKPAAAVAHRKFQHVPVSSKKQKHPAAATTSRRGAAAPPLLGKPARRASLHPPLPSLRQQKLSLGPASQQQQQHSSHSPSQEEQGKEARPEIQVASSTSPPSSPLPLPQPPPPPPPSSASRPASASARKHKCTAEKKGQTLSEARKRAILGPRPVLRDIINGMS